MCLIQLLLTTPGYFKRVLKGYKFEANFGSKVLYTRVLAIFRVIIRNIEEQGRKGFIIIGVKVEDQGWLALYFGRVC